MKSRQRFFNPAVFRKDVTRFAPAWVLYTILLLCILITSLSDKSTYDGAWYAQDMMHILPALNLGYALLVSWLLFGDLFNARLCNALHALPMRRECLLVTHAAAGLAFALVPYLISAGLMAILLGKAAVVAAWWLLAALAEYLFFFGAAVFAAMCTGNRIGMLLAYAIVNFFAVLVLLLAQELYVPLLYGLRTQEDIFMQWCPVVHMTDLELVNILSEETRSALGDGYHYEWIYLGAQAGADWWYAALCAGLGAGMLGLSVLLYRRRQLECAGDFAAFRAVQPVFLVCYTLAAGLFLRMCEDVFGYGNPVLGWCFFAAGLVIGFFTGLMLLNRTTHIFDRRAFAGFGLLAAVLLASVVLTYFDVAGLTRRMPQLAEVGSVSVCTGFASPHHSANSEVTLTESGDIGKILDLHRRAVENGKPEHHTDGTQSITLRYTLADGSTLSRYYYIDAGGVDGEVLRPYFSSVECVLGVGEDGLGLLAQNTADVNIWYDTEKFPSEQYGDTENISETLQYLPLGLLEAIAADCRAGNMAQAGSFHVNDAQAHSVGSIDWATLGEDGRYHCWYSVTIFPSCENTIRWLMENDLPVIGSMQKCGTVTG